MRNLRDIATEIGRLNDLRSLVETYKIIASSTMQKIRNSVLQNRAFHVGLGRIFQQVRAAHEKELRALAQSRKKRNVHAAHAARRDKTLYFFLSANTGLYGDIIAKTFGFFLNEARKSAADIVVVGRIGKAMVEESFPERAFTYFDFPDDRIDPVVFQEMARFAAQYERVVAFYGRFRSLLTQEAVSSSISGDEVASGTEMQKEVRYLFEPSLEIVVAFFEKEIFASLLEQAFNESRLAKLASRLMLLDRSNQNIDVAERRVFLERARVRHVFLNKKQLNAISGISLWGIGF